MFYRRLLAAVLGSLVGLCATAATDDSMSYETVRIKIRLCKSQYGLAAAESSNDQEAAKETYKKYLSCKTEVSNDAKSEYAKYNKKIKTSDGKKALKAFQIALMSQLDGIEPRSGERVYQYEERQAQLQTNVEAAWQALQIELP